MFCQARHSDIDDVLSWVSSKKLGLNTNKTEATAVGASYLLSLVSTSDWTDIGCSNIPFKTSVKYLGIKIAQTLSMIIQDQISSVCRDTFFLS